MRGIYHAIGETAGVAEDILFYSQEKSVAQKPH